MSLAPIILFVYNRPEHTRRTLTALMENELAQESELFVFADGPKPDATEEQLQRIREVRDIVRHAAGFKSVTIEESPQNKGLANSVIRGVTHVVNQFGRVIVLEDDIVTHRYFLRYVNEALNFYQEDKRIFGIGANTYDFPELHAYRHDVFIARRDCCWGWGTWADRWSKADWEMNDYATFRNNAKAVRHFNRGGDDLTEILDMQMQGKIDSWAVRWAYCIARNNGFFIFPKKSLTYNIGMDGSGTHCGVDSHLVNVYCDDEYHVSFVKQIKESRKVSRGFRQTYTGRRPNPLLHLLYLIIPAPLWAWLKGLKK